ncbi:adenylate/guanylate cyclase domain-containing protein [Mesorhizobium sp.]|uniref:adenylate/guanylate cyclase domain-containing protein n=1 Tax=Mesorhizobium sp. TaxID=1871066 RepID=UPI000FE987EC|nr:MAG: adenylate/guanylate cyclase domain-containing protein [Mesorhizobium sp.]
MTVPPLDRKLLAILAADVVGYSKAMEADEAGTIARLRAIRADLTDPAIARHHGRIVKLMGDGALVAFDSIVDAVACAEEIQKAMAARNAALPEPERMVFRIGVNLGDVALVDGDFYGDGVNVAARLEQLAEPGGVMVSGTAFDHLQGKLDCPLDFVGEQQVKNIARPVRAYRLRLNGKRARWTLRKAMPRWAIPVAVALAALAILASAWQFWSAKPSIAVLPLNNYGGDEATGRLADGLTEDIITDLSRMSEFDVIARNSTDVYKGKSADVRQIGRDLKVRYVLEGSIQRQGERIRVTAQLIDSETGAHVWSESWDRPVQDLFAVQTEIADHIVSQFEMTTGPIKSVDLGVARRKRPKSLTAYELTLLGVEKHADRQFLASKKRLRTSDPAGPRSLTDPRQTLGRSAYVGSDGDGVVPTGNVLV